MGEYRVETVLTQDRTLILSDLPFRAGATVEIIIIERPGTPVERERYPLRGKPLRYDRPTEPVAEEDWSAMQ
jgi:hypothetical protein